MRDIKIKIPNFKFPKIRMKGIENIPEVNIDYDKIDKEGKVKKDKNLLADFGFLLKKHEKYLRYPDF